MNNIVTKLAASFIVAVISFFFTASAVAGNWYPDLAHCLEAYQGGKALEYIPAPNPTRATAVGSQPGITRAKSQVPTCDMMQVSDGTFQAVFLPQGTEKFWKDGLPIAHTACGNEIRGSLPLTKLEAYRGEQGPVGPQGERGPRGYPGEQGLPGRDGRDGYVVVQAGIQILEYDQGTPDRMSDMARVQITGQVFDTIQTGIVVAGINRLGGKYIDSRVHIAEINARRDIGVAAWDSRRGPSHVTVTGNCNGVLGGNANCQTTTNNPVRTERVVETVYVDRDRPVYVDRPVLVPIHVPGGGGPGVDPPIIRDPGPGVNPPIFGGGSEPGVNRPIFGGGNVGVGGPVLGGGTEPGVSGPIFGGGNPPPPETIEPGN